MTSVEDQRAWDVRPLVEADGRWLARVWASVEGDIGSWFVVGSRAWYLHCKSPGPREVWVGVPECAFAHYVTRKRDGVAVLSELGVEPDSRRRGLASALLRTIPRPLELKTDARNAASNAFYRSLGGVLLGAFPARTDPRRIIHAYLLPEVQ